MVSVVLRCHLLVCLTISVWTNNPILAETSIKHRLSMEETSGVLGVVFSPKGEVFAGACDDDEPGPVRLYSSNEGKLVATLKGHKGRVGCLAFSRDGHLLVSGGQDKQCFIWDTATYKPTGALSGHADE